MAGPDRGETQTNCDTRVPGGAPAGSAAPPTGAPAALPVAALYTPCDPRNLTAAPGADDGGALPGQERALEAIAFGIGIARPDYNIFVAGPSGAGRHALVEARLRERARSEPAPPDWCYVHNFEDARRPRALSLPCGRGVVLRKDMRGLIEELLAALPSAFERDDYRGHRETLDEALKQKHETAFGELGKKAEEADIGLVRTPVGINLVPMHNGKPMRPEFFQHLPEAERGAIQGRLNTLQEDLEHILRQIPDWEREHRNAVRSLIQDTASSAIERLSAAVREAYRDIPAVLDYLVAVERDIHEHIDEFIAAGKARAEQASPGDFEADDASFTVFRRYRVNVAVDNGAAAGAPVVYEDHPTYVRLAGHIEYLSRQGALLTDFNLIVPGALHRANGGYLVIDAEKLLAHPFSWDALKRALRARQLRLESVEQLLSVAATISLDPQPIPLQVTVVLIGSPLLYHLLTAWDAEFRELFKVAAEFEPDALRDAANEAHYARLLTAAAQREGLRPLQPAGAARIVEYAARLAGSARRLSADVGTLLDVLHEADYCAAGARSEAIGAAEVQAAIDARRRRVDRLPRRLEEEIAHNTLRIDTRGAAIGQINGLSVFQVGNAAFGHPSRITAQVRLGRGEVIDIERQVKLGGPLHSKGVLILTGFLGGRFGRDCRLALAASLVFEQSYGGVEGDSASAAELCALLSAVAQLPLRQDLALTGSVDQHGGIQAIGAVNEKIEGFFDACRAKGFAAGQGVIIPAANADELMLRSDVVAVAAAGQFGIYAVDTIDQAMALLTGLEAGAADGGGNFPADSVNGHIAAELAKLAQRAAESERRGGAGE